MVPPWKLSSALMRQASKRSGLNSMTEVRHDSSSRNGSGLDIRRTTGQDIGAMFACRGRKKRERCVLGSWPSTHLVWDSAGAGGWWGARASREGRASGAFFFSKSFVGKRKRIKNSAAGAWGKQTFRTGPPLKSVEKIQAKNC